MLLNPQRQNRYAYGLNNPYRYADPDGEFAVIAGFIATKLIAMGVAYVGLQSAATVAPEARGDINSAMVKVAKINASETAGVAMGELAGVAISAARFSSKNGLRYDPRVRARGVEDPVSHNFPYSFDKQVLKTKPVNKKNGYKIYQKQGTMNGKAGAYEIGTKKNGVIDHRFFRPNKKNKK
jgi:hypothetical protein